MSETETFTNGSFYLQWIDEDTIEIKDQWGRVSYIHGGDFECLINALLTVRKTNDN